MTLPLIANSYVQIVLIITAVLLLLRIALAAVRYWHTLQAGQHNLVDQLNGLLPQTQCGQCGYEGCLPYARAMAQGQAINQCPPGGEQTIIRLANVLNEKPEPLNPAHGTIDVAKVAIIREAECIGCTKCIKACPVDAILGGPKRMHTVITSECTGCDLCVAPCPVDCIDMVPRQLPDRWRWQLPSQLPNTNHSVSQANPIAMDGST